MSTSRVSRAKIDYDILVAIMKSMEGPYREDKYAISVLSRTCRNLHREGIKSLLACGVFLGPADMASFGHFILADPISRAPLLHSLEIYAGDVSEATLDIFAQALSHSVCLTRLKLHGLEEVQRATANRLCTAIQSLTSVTDLTLRYPGGSLDRRLECDPSSTREEYFPELIRHLQSPIACITLQLPPMYDNDACVIYTRHRDPIVLLSSLRTSLEQVALSGNITVGGGKYMYPRVTRLSLPHTFQWGLSLLQPYIASFPNVTTLSVLYGMIFREGKDVDVLTLRRSGLLLKEWHDINTRNQVTFGTWPRIESLRATIVDAYVYGISCQVTRLHLLTIGGQHSVELTMLSDILARTRPTVLRVSVKVWFGRSSLPILPPTSADYNCLSSLEIRVSVILQEFDPEPYIQYVTSALRSMCALKSIQLEFRCLNMKGRDLEAHEVPDDSTLPINGTGIHCHYPWKGRKCYLQDVMVHVDLYRHVREFMAVAPALRRVIIMWRRCHVSRNEPPPNRVVGIDLDHLPHSVDRRGNEADIWWSRDW